VVEGPALSNDEAAAVFRRAAELDARNGLAPAVLDEKALLEVAREAGLSVHAVRQAIDELRRGQLEDHATPTLRSSQPVTVRRIVQRDLRAAAAELRSCFADQLFAPLRDLDELMVFTRRADLVAGITRGFKKPALRHARLVEASVVDRHDGTCEVTLRADITGARSGALWGIGAGATGATAGTGLGIGLAIGVAPPLLLVAVPTVAIGAIAATASRRFYIGAVAQTRVVLNGILDQLS
jgi:hypothetical protein